MSSYSIVTETPELEDLELLVHTAVLVARSRVDQGRVRAAVDAVFAAHPGLSAVFEPFFDKWLSRLGGWWGWAVEPPATAAADVIARQRRSFDMRIGRLFAASLVPGTPDRLVLTASCLCLDAESWREVVEDLIVEYGEDALEPG